MENVGLYIHIPFCLKKCAYCDFVSYTDAEALPAVATLLEREMELASREYGRLSIQTVFLGGGTPSLLPGETLARLLDAARACFDLAADAEISMEANPGTLSLNKLTAYSAAGVNRLSIGVQAAQDRLLETLGRIHRWRDVESAARMAQQVGFENLSFDLMYGLPGQTLQDFQESLSRVLEFAPVHLSCYELTLEEGTPLAQTKPLLPDEDTLLDMALCAENTLAQAGLLRYEISNYAIPGKECRHNLIYWKRAPYLGIGPAAHSFLNGMRMANDPDLDTWAQAVRVGTLPRAQSLVISPEEARFESMMLGLRLIKGIDLEDFTRMHGISPFACWGSQLQTMKAQGLADFDAHRLWLTRQGLSVQNAVLVTLA